MYLEEDDYYLEDEPTEQDILDYLKMREEDGWI
jgi:hypothetical protein